MARVAQNPKLLITGAGVFLLAFGLSSLASFARGETPAMDKDFVRTNDNSVRIGNIALTMDSPLNTEEFKQYMWRVHLVDQIVHSGSSNRTERVMEAARALIKDYPQREIRSRTTPVFGLPQHGHRPRDENEERNPVPPWMRREHPA